MKMEEKIQLLIQIQELCNTVLEGISYLTEHTEDEQIKADVQMGARVLQANMNQTVPGADQEVWANVNSAFDVSSVNPVILNQIGKQLSDFMSETISRAIMDTVDDATYITASVAEEIFHFYDVVPHTNSTIYQMMFVVCEKSSLSAPKESFEYTIKLFEEQPGILSNEKNAHPGYVYRSSQQRTFDRCPICGGEGVPYYRAFSYRMADFIHPHLPAKLWMKCGKCQNLYTWQYPEELLADQGQQNVIQPDKDVYLTALGTANAYVFSIWSNILNQCYAYSKGKTLLEVGIGNGELLAVALEMGYDIDAVEISSGSAQKIANILNIPIWNGDFLCYSADKTYSTIIMGDVIEHVSDPEFALHNAYRLLDNNGVLWLSTPNFESSFSRMRKFEDPMWLEPWHISYFSFQGLQNLLHKCGFEVKEYVASNRYNGSMELILVKIPEKASDLV